MVKSFCEGVWYQKGFLGGSSGKETTCQCRRPKRQDLIPGLGRSPGGGHSNPLWYSCLENPMDRGTWWPTVHIVTKSQRRLKGLRMYACLVQKIVFHKICNTDLKDLKIWLESQMILVHYMYKKYFKAVH